MTRPVLNLVTKTTEYIGTFEQVYIGICITHDEFVPGVRICLIHLYMSLNKLIFSLQLIKNPNNIISYL